LIAVSPAVDRALDQTSLLSEVRVELCERPANLVALALIVQTVAFVFVLLTARARVHAI